MRRKLYVALCGLPDCGKSTFIKNFVKYVSNRDVSVDSLCDEEKKEMTIRSAQITCRCMELDYDFVFLDCPGHLELIDEIKKRAKAKMAIPQTIIIFYSNLLNFDTSTHAICFKFVNSVSKFLIHRFCFCVCMFTQNRTTC